MAAAVGRPDAYAGELPVIYVQLRAGRQVEQQALLDFIAGRIEEPPACPKQVTVLDAMPLTAVGKIHKPTLRAMAAEEVVVSELRALFPDVALSAQSGQNPRGELCVTISAPALLVEPVSAAAQKLGAALRVLISTTEA